MGSQTDNIEVLRVPEDSSMLKHKKFELLCRGFRAKNFLIWHVDNKLSCIQLHKFIDVWKTFYLQLLIRDWKICHIKEQKLSSNFRIYCVKLPLSYWNHEKNSLKLIRILNNWKWNHQFGSSKLDRINFCLYFTVVNHTCNSFHCIHIILRPYSLLDGSPRKIGFSASILASSRGIFLHA